MKYFHVDVFSACVLGGNGLAVVFPEHEMETSVMQKMAREFNQFETAFVFPQTPRGFPARVFTVDEELPFAGHPLLGSAAMIHRVFHADDAEAEITVRLGERSVSCKSHARIVSGRSVYAITMNQGFASFLGRVDGVRSDEIAASIGLPSSAIDDRYPIEVVSTGLPYLLVPLASGLEKARIARVDFGAYLAGFGAKFAYLFDTKTLECRTWDNDGRVEDVATGSAAGPLASYLVNNGYRAADSVIALSQGAFVGRSSSIECWVTHGETFIRGDVSLFAEGTVVW